MKKNYQGYIEAENFGQSRSFVAFNPIWHGGGAMMAPQNDFDHCAQTLRRRKLKLGDF